MLCDVHVLPLFRSWTRVVAITTGYKTRPLPVSLGSAHRFLSSRPTLIGVSETHVSKETLLRLLSNACSTKDPAVILRLLRQLHALEQTASFPPQPKVTYQRIQEALRLWMALCPEPHCNDLVCFIQLLRFFRAGEVDAALYIKRVLPLVLRETKDIKDIDALSFSFYRLCHTQWPNESALIQERVAELLLACVPNNFDRLFTILEDLQSVEAIPYRALIQALGIYFRDAKAAFSSAQHWKCVSVFSRLRLFPWNGLRLLFPNSLDAFKQLTFQQMADVLIQLTHINYGCLRQLDLFLAAARSTTPPKPTVVSAINFAYVICFYELQAHDTFLVNCLESIARHFQSASTKGIKSLSRALQRRLLEIRTAILTRFPQRGLLVNQWPDALLESLAKTDETQLQSAIVSYNTPLLREAFDAAAPNVFSFETRCAGPYWVQNVDEQQRCIVEIEFSNTGSLTQRHRDLTAMGYRCIILRQWPWLACGNVLKRSHLIRKALQSYKPPKFSYTLTDRNSIVATERLAESLVIAGHKILDLLDAGKSYRYAFVAMKLVYSLATASRLYSTYSFRLSSARYSQALRAAPSGTQSPRLQGARAESAVRRRPLALSAAVRSVDNAINVLKKNISSTTPAALSDQQFQHVTRILEFFRTKLGQATPDQTVQLGGILLLIPNCYESRQLVKQMSALLMSRSRSFSPSQFASLCHILATFRITDVPFIIFLEKETTRLLPEFKPGDLCLLLDSFRLVKLHHHDLIELVLEKMVDQLQSFSAAEVADTLKVLASMGLIRSFLTRRLGQLAFRNLLQLTPEQLASISTSLARLRFISGDDFSKALRQLSYHMADISRLHEVLFAATLVRLHKPITLLTPFLEFFFRSLKTDSTIDPVAPPAEHLIAGFYVIVFFNITDFYPLLEQHFPQLLSSLSTVSKSVMPLLTELLTAMKLEFPRLTLTVPQSIYEALKCYDQLCLRRWSAFPMHKVLADTLINLPHRYSLKFDRNYFNGLYPAQFYNAEHKIVLTLDTPHEVTLPVLRHRHWALHDHVTVTIPYWNWKQSEPKGAKRSKLLQDKLRPILVQKGLLRKQLPRSSQTTSALASQLMANSTI